MKRLSFFCIFLLLTMLFSACSFNNNNRKNKTDKNGTPHKTEEPTNGFSNRSASFSKEAPLENEESTIGKLPDDYSWAYGKWHIVEKKYHYHDYWGDDGYIHTEKFVVNEPFDIILTKKYVQLFFPTEENLEKYEFPYVELVPKYDYKIYRYSVWERNEVTADSLSIETLCVTTGVHETIESNYALYLNNKLKRITLLSNDIVDEILLDITITKDTTNVDYSELIALQNKEKSLCRIVGDWRDELENVEPTSFTENDIQNRFVPLKSGDWEDYFEGNIYCIDNSGDLVQKTYRGCDNLSYYKRDNAETAEYYKNKRENDKKERIMNFLTRRTFSCMINNVYSNSTNLHELSFERDGTGSMKFYEVEPYGKQLISTEHIMWELKDENTIRVYSKEATSGYDTFYIKGGVIKDSGGHTYR